MIYTKIEISEILKNCNSESEVLKACRAFKLMVPVFNRELLEFIKRLSCKRIIQVK